jgi:hypothetical protein
MSKGPIKKNAQINKGVFIVVGWFCVASKIMETIETTKA